MDFKNKQYKSLKTKNFVKKNNLLFFFKKVEISCQKLIKNSQKQKIFNFTIFQIINKIFKNFIDNSIFKSFKSIINNITASLWFSKLKLSKKFLIANYLFNLLAIKVDNKIYHSTQLKKNFSVNYTNYKLLLFKVTTLIFKKS